MKKYLYQNSWISLLFFMIVWEGIARTVDNELIFPSLVSIFTSLTDIVQRQDFSSIIFHTIKRTGMSIAVSIVLGVVCSTLSYRYRFFYLLFFPFLTFLKSIPTIAVIILVLIWSSAEMVPFVAAVMILLPLFYENILGGIDSIDKDLLKMADIYKVSLIDTIRGIYIPSIYFFIAPSFPSTAGLALKVVIAGEVLAQESLSIGGEIFMGKIYLESSAIFAWIIIVIGINFVLDLGIKYFNKRIGRWRKQ